ncbi:MAG: DNA/RNA non-specific endonuclease [Bacteroidales bacterium]
MTKNQRFGLIFFILLLIVAYLITKEPWKRKSARPPVPAPESMEAMLPVEGPPAILLEWGGLPDIYPETGRSDTVRTCLGFDLGYNEEFEQAAWVIYVLTRLEIEASHADRSDNFRSDEALSMGSASLSDYRNSGYDRGHLAPAADMKWSEEAMSESFLMSNMSPQNGSFNRGIWKKLEEQVRDWALEMDSLLVISGPVLDSIDTFIGDNEVGVPKYYFKVLADLSPPEYEMIAFLMPNAGSSESLLHFAVTVDSLEAFTGYDFFSGVSNQASVQWLESRIDTLAWKE